MSRSARMGRLLRTLRRIPPHQAWAQARHALLAGTPSPCALSGPVPVLRRLEPAVPFLPAPAHARCLGESAVELIHESVDCGSAIDWDCTRFGPLWAYHLHQFDYLRDLALSPSLRAHWLLDWIGRHRKGVGWNPHPLSLRTLAWAKLLLTPGALELAPADEARAWHSLAVQVETLSHTLEHRLRANHLFSNLLAVVFAGIFFEGPLADRWLRCEALLRRELSEQIGSDGAHFERSPMYHSLLFESLLDLLNLMRAAPRRAPERLHDCVRACAARMGGALELWLHPDGEIALFGDSAFGIAQPPRALFNYAAALGVHARRPVPEGLLADAGFARLEAGPFTLLASLAGPMPSYQPGHAHCDALAFELSCGRARVVTDTGVCEYVPGPARDRARATAAHATLQVAGREQAELWAAHRVGGRPSVRIETDEPGRRIEASCASWSTRDSLHRRSFVAEADAIEIHDTLEGRARPVRLALPLAPGLEPRLSQPAGAPSEARLVLESGAKLRIGLPEGLDWRVERVPYYPEFGLALERACLVAEASGFRSGRWRFEADAG